MNDELGVGPWMFRLRMCARNAALPGAGGCSKLVENVCAILGMIEERRANKTKETYCGVGHERW